MQVLDSSKNKFSRKSSILINEYVILKAPVSKTEVNTNFNNNLSIEKMSQAGDGTIWKVIN